MRIATCIVSRWRNGNPASQNAQRLGLLNQTLQDAVRRGIDLAFFPGGYLRATSSKHFDLLRDQVFAISERCNVAVAVGIDRAMKEVPSNNQAQMDWEDARVMRGIGFPWYVVVCNPQKGFRAVWNQRSVRARHSKMGPLRVCRQARTVPVGDSGIEILLCGEIFNSRIREDVAGRRAGLLAVVNLAHDSLRLKVSRTMRLLSERHLMKVFCAAHANGRDAVSYAFYPRGRRRTAVRNIFIPVKPIANAPYLTMRIWTL